MRVLLHFKTGLFNGAFVIRKTSRYLPVIITACVLLFPSFSYAGPALDVMRKAAGDLERIINDKTLKTVAKEQQVRRVLTPLIDYEEMAKLAMGRNWSALTPEQREEFVRMFRVLIEKRYAGFVVQATGIRIRDFREKVEGELLTVEFTVTAQGKKFPMGSRMYQVDGYWKLYDFTWEGISAVSNYRTQFNSLIRSSDEFRAKDIEELLKKLKDKVQQ